MVRFKGRLPSPAMIVALIALVAATGGTATALDGTRGVKKDDLAKNAVTANAIAKNAVSRSEIKANGVSSGELKDGSVGTEELKDDGATGEDIDESTLGQVPTALTAAPSGPAGGSLTGTYPNPTLGTDTVGSDQLKTTVGTTSTVNIAASPGTAQTTATCPIGTQVVSGGGTAGSFNVHMVTSFKTGNGWIVAYQNTGAASTITAVVTCLAQ